jgi:hypothetical protein
MKNPSLLLSLLFAFSFVFFFLIALLHMNTIEQENFDRKNKHFKYNRQ